MPRGPVTYPMWSRLPAALGALALFGGCALFAFATRGGMIDSTLGLALGVGSAALAALAAVAVVNLLRHEGWAVVLADDALELPSAPYRTARRDRVPYEAIEEVGIYPAPPATAEAVLIHVSPGSQLRYVRQDDLQRGTVAELARALIERVRERRGGDDVRPRSPR
jgi:hypothetical protein